MAECDLALLEIIKNGFEAIADEMAIILMRTAHSPIVRDAMDFSTALCDANGENIAQGLTTPMHLGSFYDAMKHLMKQYEGDIADGDVFIGNDPYLASGQHLPDIYVVRPIFFEDELCGWAATIAHHVDVGGLVPGSNSLSATSIHQEGLRLPFLKLVSAGVPDRAIHSIIAANVRTPDLVLPDIAAQCAAVEAGTRSLHEMLRRYGRERIRRYTIALHDYAEKLARAAISAIADGCYTFEDHIDGLGDCPEPVVFRLKLQISGDEVVADWTGTSAQVAGGINAPLSFCKSNVYAALRSVMGDDVPNCHGYTRPIRVIAPEGTVLNCTYPAACGGRGITGYRIVDCMFGALADCLPDRVAADGAGGSTLPSFSGRQRGKTFVFSECIMGVWGATSQHDGQEGVPHMASNQANVPIEIIEADYPIRIEEYAIAPDTAGAGRYRGGLGITRAYRILQDDVYFGVRSDKVRYPPYGLFGGGTGAPTVNILQVDGHEQVLPAMPTQPIILNTGDVFHHTMAGGGGYGLPHERAPQMVLDDVLDEKISIQTAARDYGVVITPDHVIDENATRNQRLILSGAKQ
ncbi:MULTISPECIES: hydantoinase B/oxoprolinase family protein [Komagataeibacter]|uniref:5-oxoprolinase n=2 Tax=Komagataeibacter TaxID=1434011 RepID=A0A0D6Q9C3_KOMXY|nr:MULTISPECIES: hydantoinase B/oxoprolinase family protein [Komagataeibacter]MBL7233059.1 hydantoinase B/oxoprolinase family protein [Komagataeibacter oboediens]MBT0675920.1 hydantoinase B/oxoprolinase family protein [Komagataeibacter oboediens]MBT0677794.1 hydantoinase B/oxoprolinase family protein [Komagataeibacter oboediens]GAO00035.1 5-oxoprolinase [Komagataeibacter xylinus NBRC 13693]GCE80053.1 N-methylhydantoinase B [Komagataeibacter oboediens]